MQNYLTRARACFETSDSKQARNIIYVVRNSHVFGRLSLFHCCNNANLLKLNDKRHGGQIRKNNMNKQRWVRKTRDFLILGTLLLTAACGGGGGSSSSSSSSSSSGGSSSGSGGADTDTVAFGGFDFKLKQGDFWEFGWDALQSRFAQGSGNSTRTGSGKFRITLGTPRLIDGVTAFAVEVSGNPTIELKTLLNFSPRWKYLAIDGNRLLGSEDGISLKVIFDAQKGAWAGGGFFTSLPDNTLSVGGPGSINNDYINTTAIEARRSASEDQCEIILGIPICGDDSFTKIAIDYFKEMVGPLGYRLYDAYSFCRGGFCSGGTNEYDIGLMASSLRGEMVDYSLEIEPNNSIADAMPLSLPTKVYGAVTHEQAYGGSTLIANSEIEPNDGFTGAQLVAFPDVVVGEIRDSDSSTTINIAEASGVSAYAASFEDFYKITLGAAGQFYARLKFPDSTGADLDLYLFTMTPSLAYIRRSIFDNVATEFPEEAVVADLDAGIYYLAVDAFATPSPPASYSLEIGDGGDVDTLQVVDWYRVTLASAQAISIDVSGGASVVLADAIGDTLSVDRPAVAGADTAISSRILDAGSYLIGIGDEGPYQLNLSAN